MRHIPRKRFGQNFLTDSFIIAEIIRAIRPASQDRLVEIGPGLGALTSPLLSILDELQVIEIDRDIVDHLTRTYADKNLIIHSADALKFDFAQLGTNLRIVGNLPYNISTPLLFHLARFCNIIADMHFMLQQEVVARMVAAPSTSEYGRLSLMLQYRFEMAQLITVPAESFHPAPKVQSAVVWMRPRVASVIPVDQEKLFADLVTAAFSQRRKTLRNTLRSYLTIQDFDQLQINPSLRAENLSLDQYAAITQHLHKTRAVQEGAFHAPSTSGT
jgi:16S rRNA (adenine1518-N6/adenine1519-N6)-dimethyltransferase